MMTDEMRAQVCVGAGVAATVLVDGTVAATWELSATAAEAVVTVRQLRRLAQAERADVETEAHRLLGFTHRHVAQHDVQVRAPA